MKKITALLSTLALTLFLPSCSTSSPLPTSAQPEKDRAIAQNTFAWINAHRAKEGINPLRRVAALDRLAKKTASQVGTDPQATFRNATQGSIAYALQVLKYDSDGLFYQGRISTQKEPGLAAINYWSKATYASKTVLRPYRSIGIGSFTKPNGETILSAIIGSRFAYDPATWNKHSRNR